MKWEKDRIAERATVGADSSGEATGWYARGTTLASVDVAATNPARGSSYIPTPEILKIQNGV